MHRYSATGRNELQSTGAFACSEASNTACGAFGTKITQLPIWPAWLGVDEAFAPGLWWFEVRNILVVNEGRKRLTEADSAIFLRQLARLPITLDRTPEKSKVLHLARTHRLSVYDAAYLELAQRHRVELATLDADLMEAARAEAVGLQR
jgi:predicted nucleic acid-binding protein